jgi:hypothetical protein
MTTTVTRAASPAGGVGPATIWIRRALSLSVGERRLEESVFNSIRRAAPSATVTVDQALCCIA